MYSKKHPFNWESFHKLTGSTHITAASLPGDERSVAA